jgi:hypothetical protein
METSSFQRRGQAPPGRALGFREVGMAGGHGAIPGQVRCVLPSSERNFTPAPVSGNYYARAEAAWLDGKYRFLHVGDAWLIPRAAGVAPPPDFV